MFWFLYTMLLLTSCEVNTGKYSDHSFEVPTKRSEGSYEKLKCKYFLIWAKVIGQ